MSRPLRLEFAGALYHITSQGNGRNLIYLQDDDFELFLQILANMVNSPEEWLWSSWHCKLGNVESPVWMSTDILLIQFDKNRQDAIQSYIDFVKLGVGNTVWATLQHQIFLGDGAFVAKHQAMQDGLEGDY